MSNLDWNYIKHYYPKAYAKLIGDTPENQRWVCSNGEPLQGLDEDEQPWTDSLLYIFFDEHKLYCSIKPSLDDKGELEWFDGCVSCKAPSTSWGTAHYPLRKYADREAAQQDTFNKAFDILETWLNGQEYTKD